MKKSNYSLFLLMLLFPLLSWSQGMKKAGPRVRVSGGVIEGQINSQGLRIFKGIPFAQPPVGALRWKAPQPVKPWKGVRLCDHFGPSPEQGAPVPFSMWSKEFLIPDTPISEDCLYLNVWTSARKAGEKRPVLVWIYGGGFMSGGSGVPIYDGAAMAAKGIVFVSINYRVGIFGFFSASALSQESGQHVSGNYGLLDQLAALRWVQKNIAAFGGDPAQVTIAGQSAGSMSVNCLVASPLARGLFKRAIGESGAEFGSGMMNLREAEQAGDGLMQHLHVSSAEALRALPAKLLMQQQTNLRGPVLDGYVLPSFISEIFREGKENRVSLLTGWNQEEGLLFGPVLKAEACRAALEKQYGSGAGSLLKYYPADNDSVAALSQLALSRDQIFGIQNHAWAMATAKSGQPVYVYRFTRRLPAEGIYKKYGAFHTGEVPYAYDNLRFVNRPWEPVDHQLARTMSDYWVNFIKKGDPNGAGLPSWPKFDPSGQDIMILGKSCQSVPLPDKQALELLARQLMK